MKKSMLKKVGCMVFAMSMIVASLSGCGSKGGDSDVIQIGAVMPLTGDAPAIGASMKNGADLAVKEINDAGGVLGKQIKLITEDDQNQPAVAPNAITKLIEQDKVVGVLGTYASSCSIPMAAIAKEKKVPMISIGSTNEKVTLEGGDYVFRACFIDPLQGKVAAAFAYDTLKATKVATLYDMSKDYCIGISEAFKESYEALGGEIIYSQTYNKGDSDFKAFLTEISGLEIDALYLPDDYSVVGLIAKQAREMGIDCNILGSDSWSDLALIDVGGDAVEGAYFTDHASLTSDDENVKKFVEDYKAAYKSDPSAFSVLAYDSVKLMANAIEKAGGTENTKIQEALVATDTKGLSSQYRFDENHNPIKDIIINKVEDGQFIFVDQISPE
ncbi:ABC transporter substrate-binding protein [Lachnospiraceae bacterium ZAX-1]